MRYRMGLGWSARIRLAALALGLGLAGGAQAQQEVTPAADLGADAPLPVAIHAGTCGEGGDLAAEPAHWLGELGPGIGDRAGDVRGLMLSPPVLTLETAVDATFDDLLDSPHAVVVHGGDEAGGPYLACGQLGGVVRDGELAVGLRPLGEERYYGVAVLEEETGAPVVGEDETEVTVYLFQEQGPVGPRGLELGATPAAGAAAP